MSRRHAAVKRVISPDTKYNSVLVAKFINHLMRDGKKSLAEKIVYNAFERIEKKHGAEAFKTFTEAMSNVKPYLEVTSVRVGGANYQVPVEVRPSRRMALGMRWIRESAKKRSEKSIKVRLANELLEASEGKGGAVKKRDEVHKMAEANKAFSHFRF